MRAAAHSGRTLLVTAVLLVTIALLASWTAGDRSVATAPGATLPELVTALAGLVVLAALAWLALLTALIALEPLAGRRLTTWAGCPAGVRRLLLVVCGVAATSALALPADAAGTAGPDPIPSPSGSPSATTDHGTSALLDGLPMPDRPTGAAPRSTERPHPAEPAAAPRWDPSPASVRAHRAVRVTQTAQAPQTGVAAATHTIRAGDTLWDVAAQRLGPRADAAATARAWRLIYAANRDLVGPDPDLIQPGTTLRVPPTVQEDRP